jgi:large subunit ribosomal protein L11
MSSITVLVPAGQATPAAPLGPALGPLGVNVGEVVAEINKQTAQFKGMKVPVTIKVDPATRKFEVIVGSPPMSALIKKELGIEKGAQNPKEEVVGNLTMEQVVKIAKTKLESSASSNLKSVVKEVIGTCNSMGVTVEGKRAALIIKDIDAGRYDELINRTEHSEKSS